MHGMTSSTVFLHVCHVCRMPSCEAVHCVCRIPSNEHRGYMGYNGMARTKLVGHQLVSNMIAYTACFGPHSDHVSSPRRPGPSRSDVADTLQQPEAFPAKLPTLAPMQWYCRLDCRQCNDDTVAARTRSIQFIVFVHAVVGGATIKQNHTVPFPRRLRLSGTVHHNCRHVALWPTTTDA
jgi:hypothetical protein